MAFEHGKHWRLFDVCDNLSIENLRSGAFVKDKHLGVVHVQCGGRCQLPWTAPDGFDKVPDLTFYKKARYFGEGILLYHTATKTYFVVDLLHREPPRPVPKLTDAEHTMLQARSGEPCLSVYLHYVVGTCYALMAVYGVCEREHLTDKLVCGAALSVFENQTHRRVTPLQRSMFESAYGIIVRNRSVVDIVTVPVLCEEELADNGSGPIVSRETVQSPVVVHGWASPRISCRGYGTFHVKHFLVFDDTASIVSLNEYSCTIAEVFIPVCKDKKVLMDSSLPRNELTFGTRMLLTYNERLRAVVARSRDDPHVTLSVSLALRWAWVYACL
jgi:hypothetical protein